MGIIVISRNFFTLGMNLKGLGSQAIRFLGKNPGFLALPDFLTM